jgi:hypothetical protein
MATADLTYSRDDTVREIASYYDFLSTIYLPPAVIKRPPPGGWPEITSAYLGCLHKNEEVINLIRHLPFVQRDEYDDLYNIFSSTAAVDFTGELVRKKFASDSPLKAELVEPGKSYGDIPAHVLTLATPAEGRIGYYFLIDTERGTAVMCDLQVGPHPTELSQVCAQQAWASLLRLTSFCRSRNQNEMNGAVSRRILSKTFSPS